MRVPLQLPPATSRARADARSDRRRSSLYLCDNKFHTEALAELLESDSRFGFIVMDGNGTVRSGPCGLSWPIS